MTIDNAPLLNVIGDLKASTGISEAFRAHVRALQVCGVPLQYAEVRLRQPHRGAKHHNITLPPAGERASINYIHLNGQEFVDHALPVLGTDFFRQRYNIGYWMVEVDRPLNPTWETAFAFLDEIWTATRYSQAILQRQSPIPVYCVPHPIELPLPSGTTQNALGLPEDSYMFLHVFDPHSAERKNPLAVTDAYRTAFVEPGSRTTLVIKTHSLEQFPALFQEMRDAAKSPNIALINEQWPRQKMSALYHTTDAYVSLHRAEGFGLPGAEAMAAGKPVIATGWSGNMDYMTLENSFPVDYRLVRHEYNSWWAEPDVAHAAQLMRHIYNNHETAQSHGNAAARTLQTGHSPQAIGRTMRSHLIRIVSRAPSARAEVRQQDELQRLSVDIRDAYAQWEYARMTETQVRAAGWPIVGFLIRTVFRVRSMGKQAASLSVLLAHVCNYTYRNWQLNREISAQLKDITARLNALEDQQQDA